MNATSMNTERARYNMIEQQVRPWDVLDQRALDLLQSVPREAYVPAAYRGLAFADVDLPLGHGQTMPSPRIEGRILQAVAPHRNDRVLLVGSGAGHLAALLAGCAAHVYAVEPVPELAQTARANLERQRVANVTVETGDAARGWLRHSPYDVIVLTASLPELPAALLDQLAAGGRLFAVVGEAPVMTAQLVRRLPGGAHAAETLFETCVPRMPDAPRREAFRF